MPSNHPIPTLAAIALSLYSSTRTVERLPTITEYQPHDFVLIVPQVEIYARGTGETL